MLCMNWTSTLSAFSLCGFVVHDCNEVASTGWTLQHCIAVKLMLHKFGGPPPSRGFQASVKLLLIMNQVILLCLRPVFLLHHPLPVTHTAAWKDVATRGVFFFDIYRDRGSKTVRGSRWQIFCFLNQILFSVDLVRARDRFLDRNLDVRKALISSGARGRGIICAPKRQTKFGARDHVDV